MLPSISSAAVDDWHDAQRDTHHIGDYAVWPIIIIELNRTDMDETIAANTPTTINIKM